MENIHEIVKAYLKDNLRVEISTRKEYDFGYEYTVIEANTYLGDDLIYSSSDSINMNN